VKNCTTPRTLADCEFVTGYADAFVYNTRRVPGWHRWAYAAACLAAVIAIGLMLAGKAIL
jgi:hypothetical protein